MDTKANKDISDLRAQFEAIPALPKGRQQSRTEKVAELQAEIDRLASEYSKIVGKETITDGDRSIYAFQRDVVAGKLEKFEDALQIGEYH